jgi:CPA2 family monovalent cation:H+ antiporter-2
VQHAPPLLATLVVTLTLAYGGAIAARALRLSPLLGYLVAGIMVGPFTPGFSADERLTAELAEIGVALLLFVVGIHFSLRDLVAVWRVAVPGALLQVAVSTGLGFLVGHALGWAPGAALVLGLSVAIASTAVATREFEEHGQLRSPSGRIALGWLVMQDLVVVLALVLLPMFTPLDGGAPGGGLGLWTALALKLLGVAAFVAAMLLVGRRLIPLALAWTARDGSHELFRLAVIVVALGVAWAAAELAGVSLALGAFFAGVVLAESDMSHQAAAETLPIQQIFTVLFFVSVGMLVDPMVLWRTPLPVAAILLAIVLGTGGITLALLLIFRVPLAGATAVAAALAQIGEFSFILTGLAAAGGLLPAEGRDVILAAALLAIAANPFVFRAASRVAARVEAWPRARRFQQGRMDRAAGAASRPGELSGHAILVGHGRVGEIVAARLRDRGVPYIVVEQSLALTRALRGSGIPAIYGDAAWPEVLGAARPDTARLLVIAIPERGQVRRIVQAARESHPDLPVVVRTHSDAEEEWLKGQQIEHVVMSERRTADEIADIALRSLGERP